MHLILRQNTALKVRNFEMDPDYEWILVLVKTEFELEFWEIGRLIFGHI